MYIASVYLQNVHDDPQGPDVARLVVLLGAEHLGRHVVRRVARRLQRRLQDSLLGEPEVRQLQHARVI